MNLKTELEILKCRKKYKLTKKLIEIIQNSNGYIFGGAVRDMLLHNYNAEEFYLKISKDLLEELNETELTESEKDNKVSNWDLNDKPLKYNNPEIYPEYIDRFLYPNDIDCFMSLESKKIFLMMLRIHRLRFKEITKEEPLKIYMENIDNSNRRLKIQKFQVTLDLEDLFISVMKFNPKEMPIINIDIITQDNYIRDFYPPFGEVDFECNSLLLTPTNNYILTPHLNLEINTAKHKLYKIQQIIKDIENKTAKVINNKVPLYRVDKMKKNGWKIIANFKDKSYILQIKDTEEEEICPLCCDKFNKGEYYLKRSCCKSSIYHQDCFNKLIELNIRKCCPLCLDQFDEIEIDKEHGIHLY